MVKGNKGEWSEIYTFLKLLGEGALYAGDENLEKIEDVYYPLVSIIREENDQKYFYEHDSSIKVIDEHNNILVELEKEDFIQKSYELLENLKTVKGRSFEFHTIESFLNSIHIAKLKSDSSNKRDITLKVHDLNTNTKPTLGFSIKSRIGGSPTLLNSGESTNFIYKICTNNSSTPFNDIMENVNRINTRSKIKDRVKYLIENGYGLEFNRIESENFQLNLQLIDSSLPYILSKAIMYYYNGQGVLLRDLINLLESENPMLFNQERNHRFYEYKTKNFLTDVALGMTPQKEWNGHYNATGGYIIVKEDGEIVCYHIYNRLQFQEYLINHTLLDTPSSSRYKFGEVYLDNNELYLKLNLQIRFK
ncbi:restriction endonuclease [Bacillus toyonensis]|nr:restriction endonuclease [Bacillus toyonensis]